MDDDKGILFAVAYVTDYRRSEPREWKASYDNVLFVKDTPFDTDIDCAFVCLFLILHVSSTKRRGFTTRI